MKTKACAIGTLGNGAGGVLRKGCFIASVVLCAVVILQGFGVAMAQPAQPQDPRDEIIRQLQLRLDRVEAELKEMKSHPNSAITNTPVPPAASTGVPASVVPEADPDRDLRDVRPRYPSLQFHGFGDFSYVANDRPQGKNSFSMGQLDFFINSSLAENMDVLSELVAETRPDNDVKFEVERLLLRYSPSEYLSLAVGRYHTAVGFYNTAYHHGKLFQTAVGRPLIYSFEDDEGVLPMHNVGLTANGRIPSGSLGLQYTLEIGNGRSYSNTGGEPVLSVSDDNSFKAVNLALSARPEAMPGLQLGVSGYYDRLTPEVLPRVNQTVMAGYAVYQRPKFEWLNELLWIQHVPTGPDHPTEAWSAYTQIGRQFGDFRPYVRYQYLRASRDDVIFSNFSQTGIIHGPSLGLRYDINPLATLKVQYDHYWQSRGNFGRSRINQVTTQVGFGF